ETVGVQHIPDPRHRVTRLVEVLEDMAHHHDVEGAAGERRRSDDRTCEPPAENRAERIDERTGTVDAVRLESERLRRVQHVAAAAADVEQARASGEASQQTAQVFGVDALDLEKRILEHAVTRIADLLADAGADARAHEHVSAAGAAATR